MELRHYEATRLIPARAIQVFEFLDDHTRLVGHMSRPSWRMGGGYLALEADAAAGRAVGSVIRMHGKAFGIGLSVAEAITTREPPTAKEWRTIGTPRLLVIGAYRLGFGTKPVPGGTELRVYIDYEIPAGFARALKRSLAGMYARWCVTRMVDDALHHFAGVGREALEAA